MGSNPITAIMKYFLGILLGLSLTLPVSAQENILCSCILTARWLGSSVKGNAIDLIPNSTPVIGGLIVFKKGKRINDGHVAVIKGFREDGFIVVEGNYKPCTLTTRVVPFNWPTIVGFWSEDMVK